MKKLAHRSEHTGSAQGERAQGNVRSLTSLTQVLFGALARTHGVGVRRVEDDFPWGTGTPYLARMPFA